MKFVPFCHQCGYNLQLGIEKFCPKCGFNLHNGRTGKNDKSINIAHTSGDIFFGAGFKGNKNIIAKDTKGNIFSNINSISTDQLKSIISSSTTLDATSSFREYANTNIENLKEIMETKRQTSQVLDEINKIETEEGIQIQEIKVGDLQISKNEISLKEYLLKGNERYYIQDYEDAIKWYDKAIEQDINNSEAWFDKGCALGQQKKYDEAIECYDKALAIKPDYELTLNNKRLAQKKLGESKDNKGFFSKFRNKR